MHFDVCIVGGGSAGVGAAYQAARAGAKTLVVEKLPWLGGTTAHSWVNNWEPTAGASSLAKTIWTTMLPYHPNPPRVPYNASLRATPAETRKSLHFPPDLYIWAVGALLAEFPNLQIETGATFVDAVRSCDEIREIRVFRSGVLESVKAKVYIDATADAYLCVAAGCDYLMGEDPKDMFMEPDAPDVACDFLNAVDLVLCLELSDSAGTIELPGRLGSGNYGPSFNYESPRGIWYVNRCGSMAGGEFWSDQTEARKKLIEDNYAFVNWLRLNEPDFRNCKVVGMAPQVGVRETRRVSCQYMLTQNDILLGWDAQRSARDDLVAMSDHPIDIHRPGKDYTHHWLEEPYGVPFGSLVPKGMANLLVAGRCAGLSHIAAASCRLARTMMAMGEAAGFAGAAMARRGIHAMDFPASTIGRHIKIDDRDDFTAMENVE